MKKLTKDEFIEKSRKIHGDKYDYSIVEYTFSKNKVRIICDIHGEFEQKVNNHLQGQGCPKCGQKIINDKLTLTTEYFIDRARITHGDKYNYSSTKYITNKHKVKIICNIHGEFEQYPIHHIKGSGCYKCNGGYQLKLEDFIQKSNITHNNKYNYSKSIYTKAKNKLTIICPIHGEFEQDAFSHMKKCGCPRCNGGTNLLYNNNDKYLYLFKDIDNNLTKIGMSWSPEKRLNVISTNIILLKQYERCSFLERILHKKYSNKQKNHPVYTDGKTEWYILNDNDVNNIDRYIKLYHINLNFVN